ncbi:MAG: hypothetical protein UY31_C0002G0005 [Candidatus Wolfebacteria bacterium GW2011_GWE1_48_7]|uniref:Uncharacterized protein n=2 Tax=Candidatus Wolfeibacteriota TaxID=1752735 RepID=A0A0G1U7Y4_9BACT|nr:MAG: hypothetical protein UX70_C0001G0376 [Candidatus Wolfebacteria bacterium GW2011_GWB1_47_1]KKU36478.1 MAG: hypothetical protein UX49_C0015G0004 [Candidatus Wolfebacteria bacterium GW2011_GWC2_46_275]KKU42583.1 MAG: hypothetical protein UX58_C0001G0015 [Candidatus Wolfebacteria bacterium GW2011_GWB2_46_69]KKU54682.1 MAG: hypothetical protein UX76_C0001G0141 [Candidatus Wolfebacteria bacterium GW2011_GWC1_47_103]KKU58746.1 MAG: hypothetical protein UX83_C0012G0007 [Candidatus Wolfebacteria
MKGRVKRKYPLFRNILIRVEHYAKACVVRKADAEQVERCCILLQTSVVSHSHRAVVIAELTRIAGMLPEHFTDMRKHIEFTRQELSAAAA